MQLNRPPVALWGVALEPDPSPRPSRYAVRLETGEVLHLKPENLLLSDRESPSDGSTPNQRTKLY